VHGPSRYDLVLGDWRAVGGAKVAHRLVYELNGMRIAEIVHEEVRVEAPAPTAFDVPPELLASAPRPATGEVPWQWVLRRQHIGVYLDSDRVHYDPAASPGLRLVDVAPGVAQVQGGSHNSLIVDLGDGLAVLDAPIDDAQSRWTLHELRARFPERRVKHLALTHHHMDHVGGARAYVAEGASVVVGAGAGAHFAKALGPGARIVEVADRLALAGPARSVELLLVANPHAEGMLVGWVPDARLAFATDLWSPGRDKLGDQATPGQAALVAGLRARGVRPERVAGGHGTVGEYAPLEALVGP
jgi:glyoxylase-like metal-dependent hydrolase (beta-lactamase superfamily II)